MLPVVEAGQLVGLISLGDLVRRSMMDHRAEPHRFVVDDQEDSAAPSRGAYDSMPGPL